MMKCSHCDATVLSSALTATPAVGGEARSVDITGWKLVPDDPTEEMWQAGRSADEHPGDSYSKVWRAMFNAAPDVDDCETTALAPPASPLRGRDGEDAPCFYCGEQTCSVAGDPGRWPLVFCQPDGTGIARWHHTRCVTDRLFASPPEQPAARKWTGPGYLEQTGYTPTEGK